MAGVFELIKTDKGQFRFLLKAGNGLVILTSEFYESKAAASNGIESVRKNANDDSRYEKLAASDGRPYFNLKAANSQVIGTSQMYADEAGRATGIESVKAHAADATLSDMTGT
jgi:uncharacterized protein YegP (UPF0339 family)